MSYGNISVAYTYDNKGRISQKTTTGIYNNPMVQNFHYDSKVQLLATDESLSPKDRVIKKSEKKGLFTALDLGDAWLERQLKKG